MRMRQSGVCIVPVSYTHLDVYKRQVQDTGSYGSAFGQTVILLLIQIGGLGVITGAVTFLMLSGRNITVSYTHLDVYKRQP